MFIDEVLCKDWQWDGFINTLEASLRKCEVTMTDINRACQRIHLKESESRDVSFEITDDLFKFYDYQLNHVLEPGDFEIMIGPDSNLKNLKKTILTIQ